jgi:hypothetical protein
MRITIPFMKEESVFLDHVGDSPRMRLLQFLIEGREMDYSMTDLLNSNVSWGTLHTLVPALLQRSMIVKTRSIGRANLYKINSENTAVKELIHLYDALIYEAAQKHVVQQVEVNTK